MLGFRGLGFIIPSKISRVVTVHLQERKLVLAMVCKHAGKISFCIGASCVTRHIHMSGEKHLMYTDACIEHTFRTHT